MLLHFCVEFTTVNSNSKCNTLRRLKIRIIHSKPSSHPPTVVEGPITGPPAAFWGFFAIEGPSAGPSTALGGPCRAYRPGIGDVVNENGLIRSYRPGFWDVMHGWPQGLRPTCAGRDNQRKPCGSGILPEWTRSDTTLRDTPNSIRNRIPADKDP